MNSRAPDIVLVFMCTLLSVWPWLWCKQRMRTFRAGPNPHTCNQSCLAVVILKSRETSRPLSNGRALKMYMYQIFWRSKGGSSKPLPIAKKMASDRFVQLQLCDLEKKI